MISSRYVFIILFSFRLITFHISCLISFNQLHMLAMSKFIAASRHATEMDQNRIRLEAKISEVQADCRGKAEVAAKDMDEVKELKNLVKKLKADAAKKDIIVLTIFRRGMMSCATFLKKLKKTLSRSSKLPVSLLPF